MSAAQGHPQRLALQIALFAFMTVVWGSSYFFTHLALGSFNPMLLVLLRMSLATVALAAAMLFLRQKLPRRKQDWGHFAVLGVISIALPYVMLTAAQQHLKSSLAVVVGSTTPIFVFLIATFVLRTERFSALRVTGVLVAFAGIAVMHESGGEADPVAVMVVVGACLLYGAANVYTRKFLPHLHPLVVALGQIAIGTAYLGIATLVSGNMQTGTVTWVAVLSLLELGVMSSALCYFLFFHFIKKWGSTITSMNTYLQPGVGVFLGVAVLGEQIGPRTWLSMAIVLAGVILCGCAEIRRALKPPHGPRVPATAVYSAVSSK